MKISSTPVNEYSDIAAGSIDRITAFEQGMIDLQQIDDPIINIYSYDEVILSD